MGGVRQRDGLASVDVSWSQLHSLVGIDGDLVEVEMSPLGSSLTFWVDTMQTTGTFPEAHDNTTRKPKGKKGKR